MPLYDIDAANTQSALGKVYDVDAGGTTAQHGKLYDVDDANTQSLLYTAEHTITVTNNGLAAGWRVSWSDSAANTWNTPMGSGTGRVWVYANVGGWAWGETYVSLYQGTTSARLIGEFNIQTYAGGPSTFRTYNGITSTTYGTTLYMRTRKILADQGGSGNPNATIMIVPIEPIESALGRTITAAEALAWIGTGWRGSKTITITD